MLCILLRFQKKLQELAKKLEKVTMDLEKVTMDLQNDVILFFSCLIVSSKMPENSPNSMPSDPRGWVMDG